MNGTINLSSTDEAVTLLSNIQSGQVDISDNAKLKFLGDDFSIKIYVDGEQFHGCSMPSAFAKGLADYQSSIYKAAAAALYGVDDIRRLTNDDLASLQLVYSIRDGSLDLQALAEKFIDRISDGFNNMTGKEKLIAIITCVLILTSGAAAYYIVASENETEVKLSADAVERERIGKELKLEKEKTEQFKVLADAVRGAAVARDFQRNVVDGNRAIIKGSEGAAKVRLGVVELDSDKIQDVNSRGARAKSESEVKTGEFVIVKIEPRDGAVTKFWLSEPVTGFEFPALVEDSNFTEDQLRAIWSAAKNRSRLRLEVNLVKVRGVIKSATVINLPG
ncbi:hypothetical protein [Chromobacterium amazonense]|uniref:hypothetical protein n=1 Tax=Chromobacterium TaxID=535 RepID=UPI0021B7790D|nr:hypothetical protein [Chromobacterium amazonense]MBM2886712.1 hypothetical protein [Chromobacterium amazonense]MDE1712994.1 hypothetical protein [Chromobacterium amazonense]